MWKDWAGNNRTSAWVVAMLKRAVGVSYSIAELEDTFAIGEEYNNGDIWLQRMS